MIIKPKDSSFLRGFGNPGGDIVEFRGVYSSLNEFEFDGDFSILHKRGSAYPSRVSVPNIDKAFSFVRDFFGNHPFDCREVLMPHKYYRDIGLYFSEQFGDNLARAIVSCRAVIPDLDIQKV